MIDISIEEHAYFIGFVQGDGSLYQQKGDKGKLSIELSERDKDILEKFVKIYNINSSIRERTRDTNFKDNYKSIILTFCDLKFRTELVKNGVPYGSKSELIQPPKNKDLNNIAYLRGLIDADGSVGITKKGEPFISLCTKSEAIKEFYLLFVQEYLKYTPNINRNKRDNIYNIAFTGSRAQILIKQLYLNSSIHLERKYKKAMEALQWKRPKNMRKEYHQKKWTKYEDDYIMNHSTQDAMNSLGRNLQSISMRKWRLNKKESISNL